MLERHDHLCAASEAPTSQIAAEPYHPPLTPMQSDILDALHPAGIELMAKEIAVRAGYKNSSRLRTELRRLLLRRFVQRGARGYRLPNQE